MAGGSALAQRSPVPAGRDVGGVHGTAGVDGVGQPDEAGVGPGQRRRGGRRLPRQELRALGRRRLVVPHLLGEEQRLVVGRAGHRVQPLLGAGRGVAAERQLVLAALTGDRKSTRLNSSHANISYAVFCLKKKKISSSIYTSTCT